MLLVLDPIQTLLRRRISALELTFELGQLSPSPAHEQLWTKNPNRIPTEF